MLRHGDVYTESTAVLVIETGDVWKVTQKSLIMYAIQKDEAIIDKLGDSSV